jgi:hypothetical protein
MPVLTRERLAPAQEARTHLARTLRDFFRQTATHLEQVALAFANREKVYKRKPLAPQAQALLDSLAPNWEALAEEIEADLAVLTQSGGAEALAELGLDTEDMLSAVNRIAQNWASDRAAELVGMRRLASGDLIENPDARYSIASTTRDDLRDIVAQAFEDGSTIQDLAARIRAAGAFDEARAQMIADTEASRAESQGNLAGWRESGQVATVAIVLSADHDLDDECDEAAAGSPYEIDAEDLPDLPLHPRCTCSYVIHALAGDEEEAPE